MNWDDVGFLLSKNRYNENSLIVEIFTKDHGKISGIIFGGTSKKIKNYLQIGNQLYTNFNSKTENRIGYFKIEILKAYSPIYFDEIRNSEVQRLQVHMNDLAQIQLMSNPTQKNRKDKNSTGGGNHALHGGGSRE